MKKFHTLLVAGTLILSTPFTWANGDSVEERLETLERRLLHQEERLAAQNEVIAEKERQIAELAEFAEHASAESSEGNWYDSVEISGLVEVEAGTSDPYEGKSESDVVLATVELGIAAQVHDWVSVEAVILHEEDDTEPWEVDVATVTIADPDSNWSLMGGQYYLPFGVFETTFISDPLTLELGETRESAIQVGFESGGMNAAFYTFNGNVDDDEDDRIASYGSALGYAHESEASDIALSVMYISNILDSDSLQEGGGGNHVHGLAASAVMHFGNFSLFGEYLGAQNDDISTPDWDPMGGAMTMVEGMTVYPGAAVPGEPTSWMLEAAYNLNFAGRDATLAIGYQETDEAYFLELPEQRLMAGFSVALFEQVSLDIEWAHDKDYDGDKCVERGEENVCGTGKSANTVTVQLATEF